MGGAYGVKSLTVTHHIVKNKDLTPSNAAIERPDPIERPCFTRPWSGGNCSRIQRPAKMNRLPYGEAVSKKTTESFFQKFINAKLLIEYLEANGFQAAQTRLGDYVRFYERYLTNNCTEKEIQDNLLFVIREMDEWSWVYRGLKLKEPEGFLDLLKVALGGPTFAKDERENTHPRNIQLELRIGSYFLQSGFSISFVGLSDLVVDVKGYPVFVECKRLNSSKHVMSY
jgi:hypothetical protein